GTGMRHRGPPRPRPTPAGTGCPRLFLARSAELGEESLIGEDDLPRADGPPDEDPGGVERVRLQECLGGLGRVGLVDDQRSVVVGERAGGEELVLLDEARQIHPVGRPGGFHLRLVLAVLDYCGVLHGRSSVTGTCWGTTRSAGK